MRKRRIRNRTTTDIVKRTSAKKTLDPIETGGGAKILNMAGV